MKKEILAKMKKTASKIKKIVWTVVATLTVAYIASPVLVYASDSSYLRPINNLKTIMFSIIVAAGVLILGYGILKFATSFQKMDQNGEHQAVYAIIAGAIMIGISAIVSALV